MNILFITASYLPTINGVSYQVDILKKALEKNGNKVYILAPSFAGYKDTTGNIIRYPSIPNPVVKSYPIGIPLYPIRKLRKLNLDVIHTHHPFIWGQFAKTVSQKLGIPLFFTAHTQYGQYLDIYIPIGKKITSTLLKRDIHELAKKCHKVICPSYQAEKRLIGMGIPNTLVVNNAIEENFFRKPNNKAGKNLNLVYTGRLNKEKNVFFLLKVAKELKRVIPKFRLLIIGSGLLKEKIAEKIVKYKLSENVSLAGEINRSLLPQIYKDENIFITPSLTEVMPLTVIEAMACGLPIIALEKSGLNDLVLDGKNGFLLKSNPRLISQKIAEILSNPKLLKELSLNSYKHAHNFSVTSKAHELETLYNEARRDIRI